MDTPNLTVELIPKTTWYSNVRKIVDDDEWDRIRRATYRDANYECEICGGTGPKWPVECHEKWDFDESNYVQTLEDLLALCPSCHEVKHIGLARMNGHGDRALEHLADVNDWSMERARKYVQKQFTIWERRSLMEWDVNIDLLDERFGITPPQ